MCALQALNAGTGRSQLLQNVTVFLAYQQLKFLCTVITSYDVKMSNIFMWGFDVTNQTIPVLVNNNLKSLLILFGIKGLCVDIFYVSLNVISILRWKDKLQSICCSHEVTMCCFGDLPKLTWNIKTEESKWYLNSRLSFCGFLCHCCHM